MSIINALGRMIGSAWRLAVKLQAGLRRFFGRLTFLVLLGRLFGFLWGAVNCWPLFRRSRRFSRRYSAQISFGLMILMFLAVSVGEGQAYDIGPIDTSSALAEENEGFLGKPEVFVGQTVLTGEIQQSVAIVYQVESGDSLVSIAKRYNLSVGSILDANNLDPVKAEKIMPGAQLLIPAEDTDTSTAWLDKINKVKEDERKKAEAERQKRLAKERRQTATRFNTRIVSGGSYAVLGTYRLPYNGGIPGQCTNWALYKRPDLPRQMGNGGQYLASARRYGISTGSSPKSGSLIVTTESRYGHVGYVESVGSGTVTITDMNYAGPFIVTRRTIPVNSPVIRGYVY